MNWDEMASPKMALPAAWVTALMLRRHWGSMRLALGTSLAVLAEETLKRLVSRRRPNRLGIGRRRSFPSGHSAGSLAYLLGVAWMIPHPYRPLAFAVASMAGAGVNVLRVREREHWPTDVLAGDLIGALGMLGAHVALGRGFSLPAKSASLGRMG